MFPIWRKIRSSYREAENTEFHISEEIVIQNSFKVYCHSLCQTLKIFSTPSSTCFVVFFFIKNYSLQEEGFYIRIWLLTEYKWCFSTNMFEYSVLAISGRVGALKI